MTDQDIKKLMQNFSQTLIDDGEALGVAIALTNKNSQNLAMTCYASPFELGYLISKAVETMMNTYDNERDIDDFTRGLVETMHYLNDKKRKKNKRLH